IQKVRDVFFWRNPSGGEYLNEHLYSRKDAEHSDKRASIELSERESAIIRTLIYFDIFSYPLTSSEIVKYCSFPCPEGIGPELERMLAMGIIGHKNEFYFLGNISKADNRVTRNSNAAKYMPLAIKYSKWIGALPFVQSVCISGSLSKMDMGKNSDIDYFVVVKANRVWVMRLIFSLLIKPFTLIGLRNKYLCPNYIIDENHLEIRDKNLYTAIEIVTLIPLVGNVCYERFLKANPWVNLILPNGLKSVDYQNMIMSEPKVSWLSSLLTSIDNAIFKFYKWYYKRKFYNSSKWNIRDFELKFSKFEYKNHLSGHRNRILVRLEEDIRRFEGIHNTCL
ncbi:MAG: hypothetical protein K2Q22_10820, partial [Cytophagales bacterium]|nr:hypothetical protein [Cytophagales bacterium]